MMEKLYKLEWMRSSTPDVILEKVTQNECLEYMNRYGLDKDVLILHRFNHTSGKMYGTADTTLFRISDYQYTAEDLSMELTRLLTTEGVTYEDYKRLASFVPDAEVVYWNIHFFDLQATQTSIARAILAMKES